MLRERTLLLKAGQMGLLARVAQESDTEQTGWHQGQQPWDARESLPNGGPPSWSPTASPQQSERVCQRYGEQGCVWDTGHPVATSQFQEAELFTHPGKHWHRAAHTSSQALLTPELYLSDARKMVFSCFPKSQWHKTLFA